MADGCMNGEDNYCQVVMYEYINYQVVIVIANT